MSEATVFVDDAVRGTLPDICAKDGVPATGRFRMTTEVGRSNRIGILWLLAFFGPLGWLALLYLLTRDSGEVLAVAVPYSDEAYERYVSARRRRTTAVIAGLITGLALLVLTLRVHLGASGFLLTFVSVAVAVAVALAAEFQMGRASVGVSLDASRRWVTLTGVHPAFAQACRGREQRVDQQP